MVFLVTQKIKGKKEVAVRVTGRVLCEKNGHMVGYLV
jgi:hypothetical protein